MFTSRRRLTIRSFFAVVYVAVFLVGSLLIARGETHAASIFATTPNLTQIPAPASVFEGALESNTNAFVFREQANFTLGQNLTVDASNVGAQVFPDGSGTAVPGIIPSGTPVDSFLVHFDAVGQPTIAQVVQWALTFNPADQILGLIYNDATLDASDFLGAAGTAYPTGVQFRGTTGTLEGTDDILFNAINDVVSMQSVTVEVDQIRIVLVAIPEPTSMMLATMAAIGGIVLTRVRRCGLGRSAS